MSEAVSSGPREGAVERALSQPWYHTIDLAPGMATDGVVDLRRIAPRALPDSLAGKRALDVGTFDGFWAFELEKRGADVVATDLDHHEESDWPPINRERLRREMGTNVPGMRFRLAHEALRSSVERVPCNIYDISPERLGGQFDLALIGALLLHLRDPVRGMERVRSILKDDGTLVLVEPIVLSLTLLRPRRPLASLRALRTDFDWWAPNVSALKAWAVLGGFEPPELRRIFRLKAVKPIRQWCALLETRPAPG